MKHWKLKKFLWLGVVAVGFLGIVSGYYWTEWRLPISIKHGILRHHQAKLKLTVPERSRWRLEEQKFAVESGFVALWKHSDFAGTIYLNIIEKSPHNGLNLEILRSHTYQKLVMMGFSPVAKNELLDVQFFSNDRKEIRGVYLRELANGFFVNELCSWWTFAI
jgi:hypothetical protein